MTIATNKHHKAKKGSSPACSQSRFKSIYARRAEMKIMRYTYNQLTNKQKRSPEYADLVFEIESAREKKRIENMRYKNKIKKKVSKPKPKSETKNALEKLFDSFTLDLSVFDTLFTI
jgi:hypothetical protein